jgi:hypothetical protein
MYARCPIILPYESPFVYTQDWQVLHGPRRVRLIYQPIYRPFTGNLRRFTGAASAAAHEQRFDRCEALFSLLLLDISFPLSTVMPTVIALLASFPFALI